MGTDAIRRLGVLAAAMALFAADAHAQTPSCNAPQTLTFLGSGGDFQSEDKWSPQCQPGPLHTVMIPGGHLTELDNVNGTVAGMLVGPGVRLNGGALEVLGFASIGTDSGQFDNHLGTSLNVLGFTSIDGDGKLFVESGKDFTMGAGGMWNGSGIHLGESHEIVLQLDGTSRLFVNGPLTVDTADPGGTNFLLEGTTGLGAEQIVIGPAGSITARARMMRIHAAKIDADPGAAVGASAGNTLTLDETALRLANGSRVTGPGTTRVIGGQSTLELVANPTVALQDDAVLELAAGTLLGDGTLGGQGNFAWKGGHLDGTHVFADPLRLEASGPEPKFVEGLTPNAGKLTIAGPSSFSGGAVHLKTPQVAVRNEGTMTLGGGALLTGDACCAAFTNAGTLVSEATDAPARIDGAHVTNTGKLELRAGPLELADLTQTEGSTSLLGGQLKIVGHGGTPIPPFDLRAGTLDGSGAIEGDVVNTAARVAPGDPATEGAIGAILISGAYSHGSEAVLEVDAKSAEQHDRLGIAGVATIAGKVRATTRDGWKAPAGSTLRVVDATTTREGQFTTLEGALTQGRRWEQRFEGLDILLRSFGGPSVAFIPGFLGSTIACNGDELWPDIGLGGLPDLPDMELDARGNNAAGSPCEQAAGPDGTLVESVLGIEDVYGQAADFLRAELEPSELALHAWDWRKSPDHALPALDQAIDRLRCGVLPAPCAEPVVDKVTIMAHSYGGLLTRRYLGAADRAAKVGRAVTIGTPYWGSPKALFPLAGGIETPEFSGLDLLLANDELKQFARNLTGLYYLYPSARYGGWLEVQGRTPVPLDGAGVSAYVDELGGNTTLLGGAQEVHASALDTFSTHGADYRVMVGEGTPTISRVKLMPGVPLESSLVEVDYANGDGTVPVSSARHDAPADRLHPVCDVKHTALPGDAGVTARLKGFLLEGQPIGAGEGCDATGTEVRVFSIDLRREFATGAAKSKVTVTSAAGGARLSLRQAEATGLIEVLHLGRQLILIADASAPVRIALGAGRHAVETTPITAGGKGKTTAYGPMKGAVTISAGRQAAVRKAGKAVKGKRADTKPPRTRVTVRRKGKKAIVSVRVRDASGAAYSYLTRGAKPLLRFKRRVKLPVAQLARARYGSVDIWGNAERPRKLPRR